MILDGKTRAFESIRQPKCSINQNQAHQNFRKNIGGAFCAIHSSFLARVSVSIELPLRQTEPSQTQTLRFLDRGVNFSPSPSKISLAQTSKAQPNRAYRYSCGKTSRKHEKHKKRTTPDSTTGQINTAKSTVLCCVCVRACVRACMQASKAKQFPGCANPPTSDKRA